MARVRPVGDRPVRGRRAHLQWLVPCLHRIRGSQGGKWRSATSI